MVAVALLQLEAIKVLHNYATEALRCKLCASFYIARSFPLINKCMRYVHLGEKPPN